MLFDDGKMFRFFKLFVGQRLIISSASAFSEIGSTPARWGEPVAENLKLLILEVSIREGYFSCGLKFEHALLVRNCDVFETAYPPGSLVSIISQGGSVRDHFSPPCWQ